jgi:hypothetical protein
MADTNIQGYATALSTLLGKFKVCDLSEASSASVIKGKRRKDPAQLDLLELVSITRKRKKF